MISYDEALAADEFHISHDGLPCTVWQRAGGTIPGAGHGSFFVPIELMNADGTRDWHHITGVNAADFHAPGTCPHLRSAPAAAGTSGRPENGADPLGGYDADGYDLAGYDLAGYDKDGYDADGYDADGYNRDGDNRDGWNRDTAPGDLDLTGLWARFAAGRRGSDRQAAFRDRVRAMLPGCPDAADDLAFCGNCDDPAWDDALTSVRGGDLYICSSCWDEWSDCGCCEERYPDDDLYEVLGGTDVCDHCRDYHYSFCDDCDGWYHNEDADDHDHDSGDGCCESPQLAFKIRNDGCEPLANDTRVMIELPAGVVSAEGLDEICRYLHGQGLYLYSDDLDALGDRWQTREGNFTKRLSRRAYQAHHFKLSPEALSQVGCIARDHSTATSVTVDVTRDLNQDASYFYHGDSCWWGSYSESRCALKTNGGFGLRSFSSESRCYPSGRAWVMPLRQDERKRLVPTFETMAPDAFVIFNGYGDLSGYAAPRVLAHMAGWTYRKIGFACEPMYVNAGGYLVAPEEIAAKYTDGGLSLGVSKHSSLFSREQAAARELAYA